MLMISISMQAIILITMTYNLLQIFALIMTKVYFSLLYIVLITVINNYYKLKTNSLIRLYTDLQFARMF